jgi:hypothetical protein
VTSSTNGGQVTPSSTTQSGANTPTPSTHSQSQSQSQLHKTKLSLPAGYHKHNSVTVYIRRTAAGLGLRLKNNADYVEIVGFSKILFDNNPKYINPQDPAQTQGQAQTEERTPAGTGIPNSQAENNRNSNNNKPQGESGTNANKNDGNQNKVLLVPIPIHVSDIVLAVNSIDACTHSFDEVQCRQLIACCNIRCENRFVLQMVDAMKWRAGRSGKFSDTMELDGMKMPVSMAVIEDVVCLRLARYDPNYIEPVRPAITTSLSARGTPTSKQAAIAALDHELSTIENEVITISKSKKELVQERKRKLESMSPASSGAVVNVSPGKTATSRPTPTATPASTQKSQISATKTIKASAAKQRKTSESTATITSSATTTVATVAMMTAGNEPAQGNGGTSAPTKEAVPFVPASTTTTATVKTMAVVSNKVVTVTTSSFSPNSALSSPLRAANPLSSTKPASALLSAANKPRFRPSVGNSSKPNSGVALSSESATTTSESAASASSTASAASTISASSAAANAAVNTVQVAVTQQLQAPIHSGSGMHATPMRAPLIGSRRGMMSPSSSAPRFKPQASPHAPRQQPPQQTQQ